jgi:2'-5' RNA ligase
LTLLFLGSVRPDRIPELADLVDRVAAGSRPFRAHIGSGGGRLRRSDGVAWLGLGDGAGTLIDIADQLARGCPPDVTEGAPAKRTPAAHLTVARRADASVIEALRTGVYGPLEAEWSVDRIQLVQSHLEPDRARYETLHESTL